MLNEFRKSRIKSIEELIEIFGKEEVHDILLQKIIEEKYTLEALEGVYGAKKQYIQDYFTGTLLELKLQILELTVGDMIEQSKKKLKVFSIQYLKVSGKLKKSEKGFDDEEVERAREYPIERLLIGSIRKTGSRLSTKCPFHEEKTPSFVVYPDNSWHCFGCTAHGRNAIDYLMKKDKLSFQEAVRSLI